MDDHVDPDRSPTGSAGEELTTDRPLVLAIQNGDPRALDRWYRAEHPVVSRLCLGFLADRTEAEDLAQDAMLHLLDHLDRWNPERRWSAWRNAVVLNLCRDRKRRQLARERAEERAREQTLLPDALPEPGEHVEREELSELVTRCLGQLSDREREAFVLRDLEGHSTADVAEMLEIGESSVRSLITLARRRLRNLIGPRLEPQGGTRG